MSTRRYPFQGQFGRHETTLTTVISYGEFKAAEQIIEATNDPAFLNEGRYENIPLHMVLSNNHYSKGCRNLKLARLLVQKGADPNLRIPFGEMNLASPSPFEELVVYYLVLKSYVAGVSDSLCEELEMYFGTEEAKLEFLTNTVDLDNTKCLPNLENCMKLVVQTSDLIDIFLRCGSNPSVLTTFAHKSLFHWVTEHDDIELAKRFLDTCRVHVNLCDMHGTSPLMDSILRNNTENTLALYETMCDTAEFVDLNTRDCCGETALFRAVFVGAIEMADRLCKDGAKLKTAVALSQIPLSTCKEPNDGTIMMYSRYVEKMSSMTVPLLASLLADSPVRLRYTQVPLQEPTTILTYPHKHLVDKIILASISPLVDLGCFNEPVAASEVTSLLNRTHFDQLLNEDVSPLDLMAMMFGQVTPGLRQLCVRTIFDQSLMVHQKSDKVWPVSGQNVFCNHFCCDEPITQSDIKNLVEKLGLPQSLQIFFDIEAGKYQVCSLILKHQSRECDQDCSASDESVLDDEEDYDELYGSEFSSVYADSDSLLFFSSDISDESSEEVDDLSDEDISSSEKDVEEDGVQGEGKAVKHKASHLKKLKYENESSASESENMRAVVETFCEDLAEDVAEDHPPVCCDQYQRLTDESTTTPSPQHSAASDSIPDCLSY